MSQLHTASHKVPKAEGLAKLGQNYSVVVYILVLKELLEPLSKLSLYLQRTETTLADAYSMIQSTKTVLETYEKIQSEELKEVLASSTFKGFKLKGPVPALSYRTRFMNAIIENLDFRFSSDQVILKSTSLASLKLWPLASEKDQIKEFGENEVCVLFNHFERFDDKTSLMAEWHMLKAILYQRYGDKVGTLNWKTINQATVGQGVDQILLLIDLVLSLPATSVMNERSFSHMKLIKVRKGDSALDKDH